MECYPLGPRRDPLRGRFFGGGGPAAEVEPRRISAESYLVNEQTIRDILESYFRPIPSGIEFKVQKYLELLAFWARRIALTSIQDSEEALRFHFGESIFALSLSDMTNGRLADVGTGAGFPGLAIKLARPQLHVTLVESNLKKCAFLHEVIRSLELQGVEVSSREFTASGIQAGSLDFATSRALGRRDSVIEWAEKTVTSDGSLLFWAAESECCRLRTKAGWAWSEPRLIPQTNNRFVLKGTKCPECST